MSTTKAVLDKLDAVASGQEKLTQALSALAEPRDKSARAAGPFVRKGESALTSRGYSFCKLFRKMRGEIENDHAKVEIDVHNRLQQLYVNRFGYEKAQANSILAPMGTQYIAQVDSDGDAFARELGEMVKAGVTGYDRDELESLRRKHWGRTKALSWLDETTGGALVAPPIQGELIELLRNNEVFMQAGSRMIAMPPSGRIVFPRQTAAGAAFWVGESQQITDSTPTTGDLVLSSKKLGVIVKIPNELFRYSSVSVEMFVREDIARVMALRMDKSFLESPGSTLEPKGIINYANITKHTAGTVGANGNTFEPEDIAKMIGKVEEANATFRTWIMRPLMWVALVNRRADAVNAGDKKGPFLFNVWRQLGDDMSLTRTGLANLEGYPVLKSTQVASNRVKGSGTDLTYILGGDFTDFIIAMGGVIEFMLNTQGDTAFQNDQTWIRGINYVDGGPRHEASFVVSDTLLVA